MSKTLNLNELQGNILRGYRADLTHVRYLLLEVVDLGDARRFLAASIEGVTPGVPKLTTAAHWADKKPHMCFNIGVTYEGLKALGTPAPSLATFPIEFVEGMTHRSLKLGDFGPSAASHWPAPFDRPNRLHLIATIYAVDRSHLDEVQDQVAQAFSVLGVRDARARTDANVLGPQYAGDGSPNNRVFFGYADSISQPKFNHLTDAQPAKTSDSSPLGTVLLGHPTRMEGVMFGVPSPKVLGLNGSFNAFRVLAQDAHGFEQYLDQAAEELERALGDRMDQLLPVDGELLIGFQKGQRREALREIVAAQMCGRWRNGTPVANSPSHPIFDIPNRDQAEAFNAFGYQAPSACPVGAHIRRTNPRDGAVVQRGSNLTRQMVRRGMPYGPDFDAEKPDNEERGLLGNFIGANLGAQFEAVMCDWLNLGLLHPDITGLNDPLIGANTPETSAFDLLLLDGTSYRLRGFPRFVQTRGGAYTFLPSLPAIEYLSQLKSQ